jgi:hypothetical protein
MTPFPSMPAAVRRARRQALLAVLLTLALCSHTGSAWSAPLLHADPVRCVPWRGILLAVGGGALAGWALMRLGRPKPPPPRSQYSDSTGTLKQ